VVYEERFWEDEYWSRFGSGVWLLYKLSIEVSALLKNDESLPYVNLIAELSKNIVEKLSEHVELEEPESPGGRDVSLVIEFMRRVAEYAIGKNPTVTLAWVMRCITYEYARASFTSIAEKPERFAYLAEILGMERVYQPPELLTGGLVDLALYRFKGYLEKPLIEAGVEVKSGGRFRYAIRISEKLDTSKASIGSLIVWLGLTSWELLRSKHGILAMFETTDARALYIDIARTRVPVKAVEITERLGLQVMGDGRIFKLRDERISGDRSITLTYVSDEYSVGIPMPKACRDVVYEFAGPIVQIHEFCSEADMLLREVKWSINSSVKRKVNVVEFMRGIQPYIFLGLWDLVLLDNGFVLLTRA